MKIYGLTNCDSTKTAIKWLKAQNQDFEFHDFKITGVSKSKFEAWLDQINLDKLLNKKSSTWRSLSQQQQKEALTINGAIDLMQQNVKLVKRPIVEWNSGKLTAGFDEALYLASMKS